MAGQLTTHVLDTAHGCPATGMKIELWSLPDSAQQGLLQTVWTNSDGRTNQPLLSAGTLLAQTYELVFFVGDYFQGWETTLPQPLFLDRVPIRFGIADANAHYHVPLLVSPWAYSTYRGS
jgi:5-hydroxyisourate hydrolase